MNDWNFNHTDDEDISNPGSEGVAAGVLDVDNVEGAGMSLTGHDGSHPTGVTSSSDHAKIAGVELNSVLDLAGGDVHLDAVVHPDDGVGVADGSAVSGVEVGDGIGAGLDLPDLAELVLGLLRSDPVNSEPSLHVVDDTEVSSGSLRHIDKPRPSPSPKSRPQKGKEEFDLWASH